MTLIKFLNVKGTKRLKRQSNVIFGNGGRVGFWDTDIIKLRLLQMVLKRPMRVLFVEKRSHKVGEILRSPNSLQRNFRVSIQQFHGIVFVKIHKAIDQVFYVGYGQIKSFPP